MKRILQSAAVLGVVTLVGVGSVHAQGTRASFHVGGGVVLPSGDFSDGAKTGWEAMGGVKFALGALPFAIRVDGTYGQNNGDEDIVGPDVKAKFFGGFAGGQFNFGSEASPVHPYILGMVGMVNNKFEGPGGDVSNTDFSFQGGAGIDIGKFFIEGKYRSIMTDPESINMIVISGGIRFGGGM